MRFVILMKANKQSEAGIPDERILTAMGNFNEELVKAGIMLSGEGLHPSAKGARVRFLGGGAPMVVDGPFAETKELVAGFWIWQCKSKQEAIDWVKRVPVGAGVDTELEIRQVFEAEDFGAEFTPEARAQEERLRGELERKNTK